MDDTGRLRREKWLDVWFSIEALGIKEDIVKVALEKHIEKLEGVRGAHVYEKKFYDTIRVENPMKDVKEAYSGIVDVKLLVKDLYTLASIVLVYGPSSVEIVGPEKKEVSMEEVQNIANTLAGVVHQFAAAGVGGIVISPERK